MSLNTSTNTYGHFSFPPSKSTAPAPTAIGVSSIIRSPYSSLAVSTYLDQPGPPKPLSSSSPTPSIFLDNSPSSHSFFQYLLFSHYPHILSHCKGGFPTTSGAMSAHEIIDAITLIMLYFQECVSNMTLPTLILVLPYDTAASLLHMGSFLKHL